eukprot:3998198-Ditylum_brightwellii.AAC.2
MVKGKCICTNVLADSVVDAVTGKIQEYQELIKSKEKELWLQSSANEFGHLAQGVGDRIKNGTDTIFFIPKSKIPDRCKATYPKFVVDVCPQKEENQHTMLTVGGNLLEYHDSVTTKTAKLETAKILFNITLSKKNAKFATIDYKNVYLNTPMDRYEYMRIPYHLIPDEIKSEYNLDEIMEDGAVCIEICKGMYGLQQSRK